MRICFGKNHLKFLLKFFKIPNFHDLESLSIVGFCFPLLRMESLTFFYFLYLVMNEKLPAVMLIGKNEREKTPYMKCEMVCPIL